MAGTQIFSFFQLGKETTAGTAVAATRMFYPDGTGLLDLDRMRSFHEGANRGTRSRITHATQQGVAVSIPFRTASDVGVAYDELAYVFSQIKGGVTGSGASADKSWAFAPSQTGANAQESYTIEIGDDTQNYEVEYCQARGIRLTATRDGLTQAEIDWFGRQATKSTKTSVSANNAVKIPGYLWKITFATAQSGLAGGTAQTNFLREWELDLDTGLRPHFYMDGNAYFGQSQESAPLGGTLRLTVDSTALAVSEFFDKAASDTVDFIQLKATGPTLGSSNYSAQMQMAVLYEDPEVIGSETDGVNQYQVIGHIAYDATWAQAFTADVVNSIAAL